MALRVLRRLQTLGGGHLQRQRRAFRGGNNSCSHGFPAGGARHIGRIGSAGFGSQQGRAPLRDDVQPSHGIPCKKLQAVRLLHGGDVDIVCAVRKRRLLAHPVAEKILCRLRAGFGSLRQPDFIQAALSHGNDQGIRGGGQLGECIAFRRIERADPAFQGIPCRFRAYRTYGRRACGENRQQDEQLPVAGPGDVHCQIPGGHFAGHLLHGRLFQLFGTVLAAVLF